MADARHNAGARSGHKGEVLLDRATAERALVCGTKFHPAQANCATAKPAEVWKCRARGATSNA